MIQIYYGFGKGKTTAAIGAGMRAMGAGMSVKFVQFLKNNKSSELSVLPFDIYEAPQKLPFNPEKSNYITWVKGALEFIKYADCDMIILDEFLDLISCEYLTGEDAVNLLSRDIEYIITGHSKVPELFEKADYITNMQKVKHPYDKGIKARKGIEY
ncbi:MAG: cob(I)yrinic acid a,c-diamide adenosyltransferase [Eubacterium sp.]